MYPIKVVIVTSGAWGKVTDKEYRRYVNILKRHIAEANEAHKKLTHTDIDQYEVEEVKSPDYAIAKLRAWDHDMIPRGILVFVTRGLAEKAEEIAAKYPELKVFVFTGLIPDKKVRYIKKTWACDSNSIGDILSS